MERENQRRADAVDRYWDALLDGSTSRRPEEIGERTADLMTALTNTKSNPSDAEVARIWRRIERERRSDRMSTMIAFPTPINPPRRSMAAAGRRVPRQNSFWRLFTVVMTVVLLIGTAGAGYLALRPQPAKLLPAAAIASATEVSAIPSFLTEWAAARSSGDVNQLSEFYVSPDIQFTDFALGLIATNRGQFRGYMADLSTAAGKPTFTITGGFIEGDHAVAEWTQTGTDQGIARTGRPPSGKPYTIQGVSVFELRDGKIAIQHDYYDLYSLLDQVDGFPDSAPAATPEPVTGSGFRRAGVGSREDPGATFADWRGDEAAGLGTAIGDPASAYPRLSARLGYRA